MDKSTRLKFVIISVFLFVMSCMLTALRLKFEEQLKESEVKQEHVIKTEKLGESIMKARVEVGITREELDKRLKVKPKAVLKWETGTNIPDTVTFATICKELGVSPEKILELKKKEE